MSYTHIGTTRHDVRRYLLTILTELRAQFARRLKVQRQDFPNMKMPCDTCAFRTSTDDWEGMDRTAINFIAALQQGAPFYCHHGMRQDKRGQWKPPMRRVDGKKVPDERRMHLCAAWAVLTSTPDPINIADFVPEPIREVAVQIAAGQS